MARDFETIETERLLLRGIDETDAELIVNWRSDPDVYRYFKAPHKITLDEHLKWYRDNYLENSDCFNWMCIERQSGKRIGVFGLCTEEKRAEVSYLLAPEWQHKGYAAEAIKGLIKYANKMLHSEQVIAEIHQDNQPSIMLVKKLGFKLISQSGSFGTYRLEV